MENCAARKLRQIGRREQEGPQARKHVMSYIWRLHREPSLNTRLDNLQSHNQRGARSLCPRVDEFASPSDICCPVVSVQRQLAANHFRANQLPPLPLELLIVQTSRSLATEDSGQSHVCGLNVTRIVSSQPLEWLSVVATDRANRASGGRGAG